jgi:hypothetical protein
LSVPLGPTAPEGEAPTLADARVRPYPHHPASVGGCVQAKLESPIMATKLPGGASS